MGKDIQNTNGSPEPEIPASGPTTVDTQGACEITGFSRQRLHTIRSDPSFNFPKPIKVGRSVRWFVSDLIAWLRTMTLDNAPQGASSVDKKVAIKADTRKQIELKQFRGLLWLTSTKAKAVPSVAELAAANQKVQAKKRQPGQHLQRRMVDTRDGAREWQYSVFPQVPGKGFVPVKVSPRKILVPSNIPEAERQQLLARATAMRTASGSPASPPVLATPKGDMKAQKTEVSLTEMKAAYEVEGKSLDDLCKRYRMGKGRVLKLLRDVGTEMRPSGRKSKPINL
ncbi:hypothetical protein CLU95_4708 [Variovorax sp. 54]|uniref:helix-turn-helix transcriptional regulator n=1 Tax=Variovorax sp. 54 TaxID=2035212 RepID=UPI000C4F5416|nr:hypothetical protein [Variovorax sp. 54]PIF77533.1 hypothetical protein CLU95_4708 [Variovorax sp. 54]